MELKKNAVLKKGERQDSMITKLSIFFFRNLLFQIQLSLTNVSVINC